MKKLRLLFFLLIVLSAGSLITILVLKSPKTALDATFAPAFQLLGRSTKSIDRALTRMLPVDDLDEAEYGNAVALRYESEADRTSPEGKYLNDLIRDLSQYKKKRFTYRVLILSYQEPNAFALPGGVIIATRGLLETMKSESELAAILAHEMGHIERSHCLDAVKFELLAKKIGTSSLGQLADITMNVMLRHSYSKAQEDEADQFSYECILNTDYTPSCVGMAFMSFLDWEKKNSHTANKKGANIFRDYFMTHPHTVLRAEKYSEKAKRWREKHPDEEKYVGVQNLKKRVAYTKKKFEKEFVNF